MTRHRHEDPLCFCEYDNIKGERSHLLATFCDCEAIDSACDNILGCQPIPEDKLQVVMETMDDRFRIPFPGGAVRIPVQNVAPFVLLPLCLCVGTWGFFWSFFGMISFVVSLSLLGRLYRHRSRNRIYYSTTLAALSIPILIFLTFVIGFRKVLLWELLLFLTLYGVTVWLFSCARRDPGYIFGNDGQEGASEPVDEALITWLDSRPIINGHLHRYCNRCTVRRPPRSGHCNKCDRCVRGRDHHCVWLDTCIGQLNHRQFFFFLVFLFITAVYGMQLTATTICTPEIYLNWFLFPSDCRFLYSDFPTGLCASAVFFAFGGSLVVFLLLLQQVLYISQNVTSLEMLKARNKGGWWFWVVSPRNNVNNHGFLLNWLAFLRGTRSQSYSI